ncbi:MAG: hypothetical protein WD847_11555 [Pirellulales bacterium]
MSLFDVLADLEGNDDLHLGRLLVLLKAFSGRDGSDTVEGLTKLAKLDFLLRYPVFLERALPKRGANPASAHVQEHERKSVESAMVRFRYGPWDFRYRRFLNLLVARGLATVTTERRTIHIGLTAPGHTVADRLSQDDANQDVLRRAKLLKRYLDLSATKLMKFIYDTFPEIGTLRLGAEITHEH